MLLPKNIFLADDDRDDVEFFKIALEDICSHCSLTVSHNGEELINNLRNTATPPDIIFIDVNMPRLDGLSALEALKQMPGIDSIPVIVYSTSSGMQSVSRAYEKGASYYFIKPASFDSLKRHIKQLLEMDWEQYSTPAELDQFVLK